MLGMGNRAALDLVGPFAIDDDLVHLLIVRRLRVGRLTLAGAGIAAAVAYALFEVGGRGRRGSRAELANEAVPVYAEAPMHAGVFLGARAAACGLAIVVLKDGWREALGWEADGDGLLVGHVDGRGL